MAIGTGANWRAAITRSFTLIYVLSLLTIFTRIQLNLLGRRNYLSSVISLATPPENESTISLEDHDDDDLTQTLGNDFDTNRRYLAFSWWLLHRGWRQLMDEVQTAVSEAFDPLNPREDISLSKLSELTVQIRKRVEGSTEEQRRHVLCYLTQRKPTDSRRSRKWLSYLLPPHEEEESLLQESGVLGAAAAPSSSQAASTLRHLLDETADLIDSPSFTHVLTLLNNEGFATLVEQKCAQGAFKSESSPQAFTSLAVGGTSEVKTKLANVLAVMARQAHVIGNGANPPNEYLSTMDQGVRELEAFAAVVYSSNFNVDLLGSGQKADSPQSPMPGLDPSSSLAPVMVDKDEEPAHVGGNNNNINPNPDDDNAVNPEPTASAMAGPAGEESAFEKAWGKAVVDEKASAEQDG